jgi:DHA1 family bicyclomycin/chloramphenicol resistance-like MFS transporter
MFLAGFVHVVSLFGATVFVGIGNGLTIPGSTAGALSVKPDLAGSASGLSGGLTVLGGAILTSITGAITKDGGAYTLLAMMLFCSAAGLILALYVFKLDLNEARALEVSQP